MMLNPLSDVRPARLTTTADIALLIIPPKLKASEGIVFMIPDAQNKIEIQKLFDLKLVVNVNVPHCHILRAYLFLPTSMSYSHPYKALNTEVVTHFTGSIVEIKRRL